MVKIDSITKVDVIKYDLSIFIGLTLRNYLLTKDFNFQAKFRREILQLFLMQNKTKHVMFSPASKTKTLDSTLILRPKRNEYEVIQEPLFFLTQII